MTRILHFGNIVPKNMLKLKISNIHNNHKYKSKKMHRFLSLLENYQLIIDYLPEDPGNMLRDHLSPKIFYVYLVTELTAKAL